jgi:excisionase family DNA binding protein
VSVSVSGRRYVGVPEVAERYGVARESIYEWVAAGQLPFRKLPGRKMLLFLPADLDAADDGAELERRKLRGGGVLVRPKVAS